MILYVDADACPVKDEVIRVGERHRSEILLVCDGGLMRPRSPWAKLVIVEGKLDAADDWIVERIGPGDICITGDIPLADRCLKKGARALRHNGELFTTANIGNQLAMRDLMADMRAANPLNQGGGGRPFSRADRSRFLDALEREARRTF